MKKKRSKRFKSLMKLSEKEKRLSAKEILEIVKKSVGTKFDESVDVSLRINLKQSKGGDLIIKSNFLSLYTVITTGTGLPINAFVFSLKALQNSIMFIPLCPNAGPTGGAGLAWPPLICNFT